MLTIYKTRRSRSEACSACSSSDSEIVLLPGQPYLTKINGRLVMAREKRPKPARVAANMLGEAFGVPITRVIRKRAKSLDKTETPLLIGGIPHVSQLQQQLSCPAPLPQQCFAGSMVPMPQYQQPQHHYPPKFTVRDPTTDEFEQLKKIDTHFNKVAEEEKVTSLEEMKSKTTITITKHICANCGRLRSSKYHHENPIKKGKEPVPAFCRKCQKDASSTSSSDRGNGPKGTNQKKKIKKGKKKERKPAQSSSSDNSEFPEPKASRKPVSKKKPARCAPSEDYIIVEEEFSDDEVREPRGRQRDRQSERIVVEEYEAQRRPLSPFTSQSTRGRSRSTSRPDRYEIPKKVTRRKRVHERPQYSPSSLYRYVQAPESVRYSEPVEEAYPRKIAIHSVGDDGYEPPGMPTRAPTRNTEGLKEREYNRGEERKEPGEQKHNSKNKRREQRRPRNISIALDEIDYERPASPGGPVITNQSYVRMSPKENSFDDRETLSSSRSHEAAQRRRRERNSPVEPQFSRPWEGPHIIHPRDNDEVVVVTERYEYRPRKSTPGLVEEERRRQEYVDRAMLEGRTVPRDLRFKVRDEAVGYYNDDWERGESEVTAEPPIRRHQPRNQGYRRDKLQDSELDESEASYTYNRNNQYDNPLRAPTPPSPPITHSNVESWQDGGPPYPLSSDSEKRQVVKRARKGKAIQGASSPLKTVARRRSISMPRPTYVHEASDWGTENSLIHSPRRSGSRERYGCPFEDAESGMTAMEQAAEAKAEGRHVKFREYISERSASAGEGRAMADSFKVESERVGGGWDNCGGRRAWG